MQFARKETGRYYLHPVDLAYALSGIERGNEFDHRFDALPFTQFALLHRAADYFQQTRSPRETWKKLDDLAPQLTEFELQFAAHDFDTAAIVLLEIDFDYLLLWGHFRLMADLHERLGKLDDRDLEQSCVGNLGSAYRSLGRVGEAIDFYEQALAIAREIGDRSGEGYRLHNLSETFTDEGHHCQAVEYASAAVKISAELQEPRLGSYSGGSLARGALACGRTR